MTVYTYRNVNEDGEVYDEHTSLQAALEVLEKFPNDTVVVSILGRQT